ncbi:MAG: hypothetical protein WAV13_03945 [Thermodesulfovibrionales bacterium]
MPLPPEYEELLRGLLQSQGQQGFAQEDEAYGRQQAAMPGPQGRQVGGLFIASSPFEAIASGLTRYQGLKQAKEARAKREAAMGQRAGLVPQFAGPMMGEDPGQARAAGVAGMLSGDPALAGAGRYAAGAADTRESVLRKAMEALTARRMSREEKLSDIESQRSYQDARDARQNAAATERIKMGGGGHGAFLPGDDLDAIADGIIKGEIPPNLSPFRSNASGVAARLSRKGYNLSEQQLNFSAEQKAISSLNSTQQVRLRQTMDTLDHSLDKLEEVYGRWSVLGPKSGFRKFNKAALAAAQQVGGETGATAQELQTLINDLTAEVASIYMGGNTPTDHALKLAGENLKADWNQETFTKLLGLLRTQLRFRKNAMDNVRASGTREGNQYEPATAAPAKGGAPNDPLGIR